MRLVREIFDAAILRPADGWDDAGCLHFNKPGNGPRERAAQHMSVGVIVEYLLGFVSHKLLLRGGAIDGANSFLLLFDAGGARDIKVCGCFIQAFREFNNYNDGLSSD